jgi:hypothetical protein
MNTFISMNRYLLPLEFMVVYLNYFVLILLMSYSESADVIFSTAGTTGTTLHLTATRKYTRSLSSCVGEVLPSCGHAIQIRTATLLPALGSRFLILHWLITGTEIRNSSVGRGGGGSQVCFVLVVGKVFTLPLIIT